MSIPLLRVLLYHLIAYGIRIIPMNLVVNVLILRLVAIGAPAMRLWFPTTTILEEKASETTYGCAKRRLMSEQRREHNY
jgi:hypothetical protein